ncbi:hypothetical protein Hanom_Chr10g00911091 [Helianthus anomalus]
MMIMVIVTVYGVGKDHVAGCRLFADGGWRCSNRDGDRRRWLSSEKVVTAMTGI